MTRDDAAPNLKARLTSGRPAVGCWLELMSPIATEVLAGAGYDCLLIDLEHGPGGYREAVAMLQAMNGSASAPLIRVPSNDPVEIKRALDCGVEGIMIPAVDSRAEAEAAVAACRYPPRGKRGMAAPIVRASGYGRRWRDYVRDADECLLVICQIESGAAVEAIDEIAAVEGVDLLFIGPFDLSANLGHLGEPDHTEVKAAIARVEAAAKSAGKLLGAIPTEGRGLGALIAAGHDLVLPDVDSMILRGGAEAGVARWRDALGEG